MITAALFFLYILLLIAAYIWGRIHGISYKRYSKDISRHNSKIKSIQKVCRILRVFENKFRLFGYILLASGTSLFIIEFGQNFSEAQNQPEYTRYYLEVLSKSFESTKLALASILASVTVV